VGPNAGGPGPSIATQALPTGYNGGLLINENPTTGSPYIQFANSNPGTAYATLTGAPITNVDVTVTQGANVSTYNDVSTMFDSGGVDGTIPFNAPTGSVVTVYDPTTNLPIYHYTVGTYSPIASTGLMNTGAAPFQQNPVYISYSPGGVGTTYIDEPI